MEKCIMCYESEGILQDCKICETQDEYHKVCYKCRPCVECGLPDCRELTDEGLCSNCACYNCHNKADYICENRNCYFVWCNNCSPKKDCELCYNLDNKIHKYVCRFCGQRQTCFKCGKTGPFEHFEEYNENKKYHIFDMCGKCRIICYNCDTQLKDMINKWECNNYSCSKIFCGECDEPKFGDKCYECYKGSRGP